MHPAHQYSQREDLHILVVLVPFTCIFDVFCFALSADDNPQSKNESIPFMPTISTYQQRSYKHNSAEKQNGRLVSLFYAWTKC